MVVVQTCSLLGRSRDSTGRMRSFVLLSKRHSTFLSKCLLRLFGRHWGCGLSVILRTFGKIVSLLSEVSFGWHWGCGLSIILRTFGKIVSLLSEVSFLDLVRLSLGLHRSHISLLLLVNSDVITYVDALLSVVPGCRPSFFRVHVVGGR